MWKILEFGHFEILMRSDGSAEELGRGSMGITYKALDRNLLSVVVVKAMQGEHMHHEDARKQFLIEAQAMAKIRHPNVPSIYYLGDSDQGCFYAMEYCQGPNLQQYLQSKGRLSPVEVFKIAAQVASALSAVSLAGFVHRDLKPANLIVIQSGTKNSQVKLIDFGLARNYSIDRVKANERFAGTPVFASPEQFEPDSVLDVRGDMYSLGLVMWYLLTGEPPFTGSLVEVMKAQKHEVLPWEKLPHLTEPYREVLKKLLAKLPDERFDSPESLENALRDALGDEARTPLSLDIESVVWADRNAGVIGDFPFEILEEKEELSFGKRFLGRDLDTNCKHALYLLHPRYGSHPKVLEAIQSVRKKLKRRTHPHLMRVTAQSQFQDRLVYALNRSLEDFWSFEAWSYQHRRAKFCDYLLLLCQLADAMDFATELDMLHVPTSLQRVWVKVAPGKNGETVWHPYLEPLDPESVLQSDGDEASVLQRFFSFTVQALSLYDGKERETSMESIHQLVQQQRLQQLESCREVLEAIASPQGITLPELHYNFLEGGESSVDTLDHAHTHARTPTLPEEVGGGTESWVGLGAPLSSLWGEIISSPDVKDAQASSETASSIQDTSLDDLATLVSRPQGVKKALEALEEGEEWLNRKKGQLEHELRQLDENWHQKVDHLEKEREELEQQRAAISLKKRTKREIELKLLTHAQTRFLQLEKGKTHDFQEWSITQEDLEKELHALTDEIDALEEANRVSGLSLFQRAQQEQRSRDNHRLDQDLALDLLREESEKMDQKRSDLERLLRQFRETRKRRWIGWGATALFAVGASSIVAYHMKGRLQDVRVVPGEQAWGLLVKERQRAVAQKDWPALVHWLAVTQRQASQDTALGNFVKSHFEDFHSSLGLALSGVEQQIGKQNFADKAKLLSDLEVLSKVAFQKEVSVLIARLEIQDLVKAKNWAAALEHFHTIRRSADAKATLILVGELEQIFHQLRDEVRSQNLLPQNEAILASVNALLPADIEALGNQLVEEVSLGLSFAQQLSDEERLSALQDLVKIGRLLQEDKPGLKAWMAKMEGMLMQSSLAPEQLFQEHTLWAEIARLWSYPRPLEVLAGTLVLHPEQGTRHSLLPETLKASYLRLASDLGSATAVTALKDQEKWLQSQQKLLQQADAYLNGNEAAGQLPDFLKARQAALAVQDQDFRKWMMLGLITAAEAQTSRKTGEQRAQIQEAAGLFLHSAVLGHAKGYFYAAQCYHALKEKDAYLKLLEKGSDLGDSECAHALALEWLETSENRSMAWFIRAAALGHKESLEYCRKYQEIMRAQGFGAELDRLKL